MWAANNCACLGGCCLPEPSAHTRPKVSPTPPDLGIIGHILPFAVKLSKIKRNIKCSVAVGAGGFTSTVCTVTESSPVWHHSRCVGTSSEKHLPRSPRGIGHVWAIPEPREGQGRRRGWQRTRPSHPPREGHLGCTCKCAAQGSQLHWAAGWPGFLELGLGSLPASLPCGSSCSSLR